MRPTWSIRCGVCCKTFTARHHNAKYCPTCRPAAKLKREGKQPRQLRAYTCETCKAEGQTYSHTRRWCEDCKPKAHASLVKDWRERRKVADG